MKPIVLIAILMFAGGCAKSGGYIYEASAGTICPKEVVVTSGAFRGDGDTSTRNKYGKVQNGDIDMSGGYAEASVVFSLTGRECAPPIRHCQEGKRCVKRKK